jgi:hypothetical protein
VISSKVNIKILLLWNLIQTDNPMGTPIYAAIAYKVLDNLSVGFSFSTPFGSTVNGRITGQEKKWYRNGTEEFIFNQWFL